MADSMREPSLPDKPHTVRARWESPCSKCGSPQVAPIRYLATDYTGAAGRAIRHIEVETPKCATCGYLVGHVSAGTQTS